MHKYSEFALLAENAGFDSVWGYEGFRNIFVMQGQSALSTDKITLGAGLAVAAQRTPFAMANAVADVDELSGGRLCLAISMGAGDFAGYVNGVDIDRPASRIREYIHIMRMIWNYVRTGEPFQFKGEFYRIESPPYKRSGQDSCKKFHESILTH